mgnify:FL=1
MFTGLVEEIGSITQYHKTEDGIEITVKAEKIFDDLKINDSVSCSGICLTIVDLNQNHFSVQIVQETLKKTNAKTWELGTLINLERSLLPITRIGGHFVQGHVDDTVKILNIKQSKNSAKWFFSLPKHLNKYLVQKGSVCLDGISLTVATKENDSFGVALIPHTLNITTWRNKVIGDSVNIEVDIMGKYIKSFLGEKSEF